MKGPALAAVIAAAICCLAPALVLLLGTIGLSAWLAWLDFAWLPALALTLGLAGWALIRHYRRKEI